MPRYFFHVKRGQVTVLDQEGVELADIDEAANEAVRRGGEIAALGTWQGIAHRGRAIVANEHWLSVFEVTMGKATHRSTTASPSISTSDLGTDRGTRPKDPAEACDARKRCPAKQVDGVGGARRSRPSSRVHVMGTSKVTPESNGAHPSPCEMTAPHWPKLGLIVGIGASAGGLAAFRSFLSHMPADTGKTFVLIQHLDPHHASMLVELLAPHTAMPVSQAVDGEKVVGNHVYVIPPDATLTIAKGLLKVQSPAPAREHRRPIDSFFVSLAEDRGE